MGYYGQVWLSDSQSIDSKSFNFAEVGVGLSALGGMSLLLGCLMLFNRFILAIGNVP